MIRILLIFCVSIGAWLFFMVLAQAQDFEVIPEKKDLEFKFFNIDCQKFVSR